MFQPLDLDLTLLTSCPLSGSTVPPNRSYRACFGGAAGLSRWIQIVGLTFSPISPAPFKSARASQPLDRDRVAFAFRPWITIGRSIYVGRSDLRQWPINLNRRISIERSLSIGPIGPTFLPLDFGSNRPQSISAQPSIFYLSVGDVGS